MLKYILGSALLTMPKAVSADMLNTVSALDIRFWGLDTDGDEVRFSILLTDLKKLCAAVGESIWENVSIKKRGLPMLIKRYRRRWGIAVGAALFFALIPLSSGIVWTVDVSGNTNISDEYIIEALRSQGFGVGTRLEGIDFDRLHNRFLMESEGISWISVNMNGTHANVEVRETRDKTDSDDDGRYFNLVAGEDGQIEQLALTEGKPQVSIFDSVRKGELLASGIFSKDERGIRLESANGSVFARVNRSFEVSVPLRSTAKEYTGEKKERKSVRFFSFDINLFRNSGIPYDFYDTIVLDKQIYLFDTVALPVWIKTAVYKEYESKDRTLSVDEAKSIVIGLYREKLSEVLGDAQILTKDTKLICGSDALQIRCELYCLADIAEYEEFEVINTKKAEE